MKRLSLFSALALVLSSMAFAAPLGSNEAYVLLNELPLWAEEFGGKLKWQEALTIGDKVTLLNQTGKFKVEGNEREYTKVKSLSGKEGWVRTPYIASKSSLAVVKAEKSLIYSEPRDVKITSKFLTHMTLVAILQDGSSGAFLKIQAYDTFQDALFSADSTFVSPDDLTTSEADVNAVILYTVAAANKNATVKKNLLNVINAKYSSTMFLGKIQSVLSGAPVVNSAGKETKPAVGTFTINDNNVNVRATPDEKNGQVLSQLSLGYAVEVLEVTAQTYTVGGMTGYWYRLKEPAGWVFGTFLTPAN